MKKSQQHVPDQTAGAGRWVGRSVLRVEDRSALSGQTAYVDDLPGARMLHAAFLRSPHAAGRIRGIDTSRAAELPGVRAVITAADLPDRGLHAALDRPFFRATTMPLLAADVVRFAGEPIAMVIADSSYVAEDAVELIVAELEPTQAVASVEAARAEGAPLVHEDVPGNLLVDVQVVDDQGMDELMSGKDATVVEATFRFGRVYASPMEGRGALAHWDVREDRLTVHCSTQVPHMLRSAISGVLQIPEGRVRVVAPDVGGGFGMKVGISREELLVAEAARRMGGAVKWVEDRQESLTSAFHAHETVLTARAAFASDGALLGVDADISCDVGAYSAAPMSCAVEPMMAARELPGTYRFDRYRVHTRAVATHKPPMAPYRGVGRPQVVFTMERLMDKGAAALGISRADIRRRNLISDDEFPYTGASGILYDRGSYIESLDTCLEALDWDTWAERQEQARKEGRLLGLGFASFSESTGFGTSSFGERGMARTPGYESAEVRMEPTGEVVVGVGTAAHGQGHRTTLAQIVADELGVDHADVRVVQGDTDAVPYGWGTFASRSAVIGGGACKRAASSLRDKILRLAADKLEAAPEDLELRDGHVGVKGSPESQVPLPEIAHLAYHAAHKLPEGEEPGLDARATYDPPGTFSNATHGVIVEIDPDTGVVAIDRYVVVEDCGVILNPMIVDGQVRGGVAQGIGKALYEHVIYDEDGQCKTGSFMDYLVPTASEIPSIELHHLVTPSEHSETGAKGMGEGGTIGAPAALANAVSDALAHLGVQADELPITPERLWAATR